MDLLINLVAGQGVPPLRFGMAISEAEEALRVWGAPEDATGPDALSRLRVRDDELTRDIFAYFDSEKRLEAVEVWRPQVGEVPVRVVYEGLDIFSTPADHVLAELETREVEVDQSDSFFPTCPQVALGFNRDGGDDRDENGLARYFESVLIAQPGYYD